MTPARAVGMERQLGLEESVDTEELAMPTHGGGELTPRPRASPGLPEHATPLAIKFDFSSDADDGSYPICLLGEDTGADFFFIDSAEDIYQFSFEAPSPGAPLKNSLGKLDVAFKFGGKPSSEPSPTAPAK